ncbi:uncharacterized protein CC84DRAFT_1203846 [Paraphaeosphaeria sporulosa]|uniref:Uncharacterized protein n=1 Tax=Paraphaeosphaeria sporulosa TaxID=1460663 RepID=A0A177CLQ7_9PLEO|nr:uncharacterized protein CC84DRAFT_1203846 [Paraphaeosphaeria sporulosa]OAG08484.1 hypothetical protein CC84DRAFT_1203846 [Paraphaeosphaeria sporulosa]
MLKQRILCRGLRLMHILSLLTILVKGASLPGSVSSHANGNSSTGLSSLLVRYFYEGTWDRNGLILKTTTFPQTCCRNIHSSTNTPNSPLGTQERALVMKDVDEIISAYQTLRVEGDRADALEKLTGIEEHSKRDTLAVLQGGYQHQRDTMALHKDALRLLKELPPLPKGENTEYPAYNHNILDDEDNRRLNEWVEQQRQQPRPIPTLSRWSSTSEASSKYSEHTVYSSDPPSLYYGDSRSSSRMSDALPADPASPPTQYASSKPSSTQGTKLFSADDRMKPKRYYASLVSSRTQSPVRQVKSRTESPIRQLDSRANSPMGQIHCLTEIESRTETRTESPIRQPLSGSLAPAFASSRPHTPTSTARSPYGSRNASPEPRGRSRLDTAPMLHLLRPVASNSQLSVTPSVKTTITTGAQEKMMYGRPCKDNDYFGFCRGSWDTREDASKGLVLTSRPEGMFSSSQVWQCRHCLFEGPSRSVPHPTKKNKKKAVLDTQIHMSATDIRYRWSFLAKSHVKKSSYSTAGRGSAGEEAECNFGCLICSVEGTVTGIYGGVETLMEHIANEHVYAGNMNHMTMVRSKVVVGRTACEEEEWDVNIPSQEGLLF